MVESSLGSWLRLTPLLGALLIAGCQTMPAPGPTGGPALEFPAEEYRRLEAAAGQVYRLDPQASEVRIFVYRGGKLAARGHNHVISAPVFEGSVFLPEQGLAQARFDVVVPVAQLEVDPPAARASLGGSFATEVDADARAGTRDNMLGPAILDAERFPRFALRSLAVVGELPKAVVRTAITLHGVTREQWLPMDVRVGPEGLVAQGALAITQQDFGIQPFSALGGLLKVQDQLMVEFRLVGRPR